MNSSKVDSALGSSPATHGLARPKHAGLATASLHEPLRVVMSQPKMLSLNSSTCSHCMWLIVNMACFTVLLLRHKIIEMLSYDYYYYYIAELLTGTTFSASEWNSYQLSMATIGNHDALTATGAILVKLVVKLQSLRW